MLVLLWWRTVYWPIMRRDRALPDRADSRAQSSWPRRKRRSSSPADPTVDTEIDLKNGDGGIFLVRASTSPCRASIARSRKTWSMRRTRSARIPRRRAATSTLRLRWFEREPVGLPALAGRPTRVAPYSHAVVPGGTLVTSQLVPEFP